VSLAAWRKPGWTVRQLYRAQLDRVKAALVGGLFGRSPTAEPQYQKSIWPPAAVRKEPRQGGWIASNRALTNHRQCSQILRSVRGLLGWRQESKARPRLWPWALGVRQDRAGPRGYGCGPKAITGTWRKWFRRFPHRPISLRSLLRGHVPAAPIPVVCCTVCE
jgi:hypothetical protein